MIDLSIVTACGGCCLGCSKKTEGFCPGCIEADGKVPEWSDSGVCKIHKCAKDHGVKICALCNEFPCDKVTEYIPWNKTIIEDLTKIRNEYLSSQNK